MIANLRFISFSNDRLPLDPVLLTISELLPKVTEIAGSGSKHASSRRVLEYLKSITLEGVLPPPPTLNPRRFQVYSHDCCHFVEFTSCFTVVRCLPRMAKFSHMGGALCARIKHLGGMEWNKRETVWCTTYTFSTRRWRGGTE